jgi:hypothetical protein
MVVPLRALGRELCELHHNLPAKVASKWGRRYGLDVEELENDLTLELCHVCARLPVYKNKAGVLLGTHGRDPRRYLYSSLRRRIADLLILRSKQPDLKEYARTRERRDQPSPLEAICESEGGEED